MGRFLAIVIALVVIALAIRYFTSDQEQLPVADEHTPPAIDIERIRAQLRGNQYVFSRC